MGKATSFKENDFKQLYRSQVPLTTISKKLRIGWRRLMKIVNALGLRREKAPRTNTIPARAVIGQKFHSLTILGFVHDRADNYWWMKVRCDCGNESWEHLRKLKNGQRKTCGIKGCPFFHALRAKNGRKAKFTGFKEIYGSRWAGWRCGAQARNLEFSITPEYGWRVFLKQGRRCALTGLPLEFGNSYVKSLSASLDRKDSRKGYIKGNVQWVHKTINLMKRAMPDKEFIEWCRHVSSHAGS